MVYRGHVREGKVVLDEPVVLPEGAAVAVHVEPLELATDDDDSMPTLYEQFESFIGKAKNLPADASINHDHYLYGVPKRS